MKNEVRILWFQLRITTCFSKKNLCQGGSDCNASAPLSKDQRFKSTLVHNFWGLNFLLVFAITQVCMFYGKKASQENINFDDSPSKNCWRSKEKKNNGGTSDIFLRGSKKYKVWLKRHLFSTLGGSKLLMTLGLFYQRLRLCQHLQISKKIVGNSKICKWRYQNET